MCFTKQSLAGQNREWTLPSDDLSAPKSEKSCYSLRSGNKRACNDAASSGDAGTKHNSSHTKKSAANNGNACYEDDQKKNDENSDIQSPFKKPKPSGIVHTALTAISTTAATNATATNTTATINTTAITDASTAKDSSSNGTDNLDAMWQAVNDEQVVDPSSIVLPPRDAQEMKASDRKAVNGVLGMMTESGESMFMSLKSFPHLHAMTSISDQKIKNSTKDFVPRWTRCVRVCLVKN